MQHIVKRLLLIITLLLCSGTCVFAAGVVDDINAADTYEEIRQYVEESYQQLNVDISGEYKLIGNYNHLYKELFDKNFANRAEIRNAFNNALAGLIENNYNYSVISGTANSIFDSRNLSDMWIHKDGKKAVFVFDAEKIGEIDIEKYILNINEISVAEGTYNYVVKGCYNNENADWLTDMGEYQSTVIVQGEAYHGEGLVIDINDYVKERLVAGDRYIVVEIGADDSCRFVGGKTASSLSPAINAYVDNTIILDAQRALIEGVDISSGCELKSPISDGEYSYIIEVPAGISDIEITPVLKNNEDTCTVLDGDFTRPFEIEVTSYDKTVRKTYTFTLVYEPAVDVTEIAKTSNSVTFEAERDGDGTYYVFAQAKNAKTPVELKYIQVTQDGEYTIDFSQNIEGCDVEYIVTDKYPTTGNMGSILNESLIVKNDYKITAMSEIADNSELLEIITSSAGSSAMVQIFNESGELVYIGLSEYMNGTADASIRLPSSWEDGTYSVLAGIAASFDKKTFELRALSSDSSLNNISVDGAEIDFEADTYEYVVEIEYGQEDMPEYSVSLNDINASYEIEEIPADTLERMRVRVIVTAENGVSESVYTLIFKWHIDEEQERILTILKNASGIDEIEEAIGEYKDEIGLDTEDDFRLIDNPKYVYSALLNQTFDRGFKDVVDIFNAKVAELVEEYRIDATYSFSNQYSIIRDDIHSLTFAKGSTVNIAQLAGNNAGVGVVMIDLTGIDADEIDGLRDVKLVLKDSYDPNAGKPGYLKVAALNSENPNWIEEKAEYVIEELESDFMITYNEPYEIDVTDYTIRRLQNSDKTAVFMIYDIASRFVGVTNGGSNAPHLEIVRDNSVLYDIRNIELVDLAISEGQLVEAIAAGKTDYTIAVPYGSSDVPEITPTFNNNDTYSIEYPDDLTGEIKMEVLSEDEASSKTYTFKFCELPPYTIDDVQIVETDEETIVAKVTVSGDYVADGYVFVQLEKNNSPVELKYAEYTGEGEIEILLDSADEADVFAIILDKIPTVDDLGNPLSGVTKSYSESRYEIMADKASADLGETITFENMTGDSGAVFAIFDTELEYLTSAENEQKSIKIPYEWNYGSYTAVLGKGTNTDEERFDVRELYDNAYLSEIKVDGELINGFSKEVYDYEYVVPFGETRIPQISVKNEETGATYNVIMPEILPAKAKIEVTAEDNITKKTYTVDFVYSKDCADLSNMVVTGGTLDSAFKPDVLAYRATVHNKNRYTITATPKDSRADIDISYGSKVATVTVTAADGVTIKTYTVNITVKSSGGGGGGGSSSGGGSSMGSAGSVSFVPKKEVVEEPQQEKVFADMQGHWAEETVNKMYKEGIVSGMEEDKFCPESNVTRAQLVTMLVRALKLDMAEYEPVFSDVSADSWYSLYICTAYKNSIINGYEDKTFRPDDNITREEMAKMAMSAYEAVKEYEYIDGATKFSDDEQISEWAKKFVNAAVDCKMINGMENNNFSPKTFATRAQAAAIIERLINAVK